MIVCSTIEEIRAVLARRRMKDSDGKIGLVPTMGYLHEGHASLMRRAKEECGFAVLSIFVNPLQFGPNEDYDQYPRDPKRDCALAEVNGIDAVFMPSAAEMYPKPSATKVLVSGVTDRLCGASRPGHFDGVGTVVSKLFHIIQPDRAYFGMKDAQQVAVIKRMTDDLNIPVDIVPCPTVREQDGLALSSRNIYLSADERSQAVVLSSALEAAAEWIGEPGMTAAELEQRLSAHIGKSALAVIDYAAVLTFPDLQPPETFALLAEIDEELIIALAVKFGRTRLIDNRLFSKTGVISYV
jgi:pantoate--beta-alanine ligase